MPSIFYTPIRQIENSIALGLTRIQHSHISVTILILNSSPTMFSLPTSNYAFSWVWTFRLPQTNQRNKANQHRKNNPLQIAPHSLVLRIYLNLLRQVVLPLCQATSPYCRDVQRWTKILGFLYCGCRTVINLSGGGHLKNEWRRYGGVGLGYFYKALLFAPLTVFKTYTLGFDDRFRLD
jgi:hypothetical protein